MNPVVAVLATLDSKRDAALFLCDELRRSGVSPWLVDLALRPHDGTGADLSGRAVAEAAGLAWEEIATLSRADAAERMITGARAVVRAHAGLAGVVGIGGANGATIACAVMRALAPGLPKVMVTPVAATAAVQWYVAESDIVMVPTIGDIWLNRITRAAIANAAAAVAGMARAAKPVGATAPLIGVSSFGNLQPAVDRITARLESAGFEVMHFHASGPGGRALESLAAAGELAGVIDLTTSELADALTGGVYSAGDTRLTAAGAAGLPQVVVPGALDFSNFWAGELPARYRHRRFVRYNVEILLMRSDAAEMARLGNIVGERLAAAKGPVRVLVPLGGFSGLTGRRTTDLDGNDTGPWDDTAADAGFLAALEARLPAAAIARLPLHINDPAFADACVGAFLSLG